MHNDIVIHLRVIEVQVNERVQVRQGRKASAGDLSLLKVELFEPDHSREMLESRITDARPSEVDLNDAAQLSDVHEVSVLHLFPVNMKADAPLTAIDCGLHEGSARRLDRSACVV